MSFKFCSRCKFAVKSNSTLCAICGHSNFITDAADVRELEDQPSPVMQFCQSVVLLGKELREDAAEIADKTIRASRHLVALFRGTKIEPGE